MNVVVFDTETTSLEKPFCYNIGYAICEMGENVCNILVKKDFVVEQIWHNPELFATAYYAEKRPIYVSRMRARQTKMSKYGYICQEMIRDFANYNVKYAFAFNSDFDEKVFNFNCDWYKCNNPFDNIPIKDIRAFAHKYLVNSNYFDFCELNGLFTDSGNYSTTAEAMFRYVHNDLDFTEEHTALADSIIEADILAACVNVGASFEEELKAKRSIERRVPQTLTVITKDGDYEFNCCGYTVYKSKNTIKLK